MLHVSEGLSRDEQVNRLDRPEQIFHPASLVRGHKSGVAVELVRHHVKILLDLFQLHKVSSWFPQHSRCNRSFDGKLYSILSFYNFFFRFSFPFTFFDFESGAR